MPKVIVIFASNRQAETPQLGDSDRAAVGLAVSRFADSATGYCPPHDLIAASYGTAAKISMLGLLPPLPEMDFDLVLIGQSALTEFGVELPGALAVQNNATLIFDVLDFHREGSALKVVKDVGRGNREEWTVSGPVVMVISTDAVRPPYVSRYRRIMAAHRLPNRGAQHENSLANRTAEWEGVRPRAKLGRRAKMLTGYAEDRMSAAFGMTPASSASANDRIIVADAATCARHLLRFLAHHRFLPASLVKALPERDETLDAIQTRQPKRTLTGVRNTSVPERIARGPRFPNDSPLRLSRRPRAMPAGLGEWSKIASLGRWPRPLDQTFTGLSRRPRRLT